MLYLPTAFHAALLRASLAICFQLTPSHPTPPHHRSTIGLAAALGAGMRCVVTYTNSTRSQDFAGADAVVASLDGVSFADLAAAKLAGRDDRVAAAAAASQ